MQPTKFDVVCGKGRSKEAGTPKYKLLVNENKVLYVKCPESDKKKITLVSFRVFWCSIEI